MSYSLFGQVLGVRKFANGDIEVDFYHDDEVTQYRYSSDSNRLSNFPKELIESLVSTLATDICIDIFFGDDGNPTHIELEECGDDDEVDDTVIIEEL
ncbi:MAG: hypothetical protein OEW86_05905 [Nitrosopumilus sp.]|nr:hypothetical protein [Nitrosopumilus sp.]MDH3517127.1 hypothetical protein [Nitrosopumilus sp.]MDH5417511.1 hypothetical protein [Nitrosopumilus sp.]MDH5555401.1 hypothetical protein [Nitrosopumilus sp.]